MLNIKLNSFKFILRKNIKIILIFKNKVNKKFQKVMKTLKKASLVTENKFLAILHIEYFLYIFFLLLLV